MPQSRQSAAKVSGSLALATLSALLPNRGQRCASRASSCGRSSKPVPQTIPAGTCCEARPSNASMSSGSRKPCANSPQNLMWPCAAATVSRSPKKSATKGRYPPRRADAANARPETAAISTAPLPIEFAGKDECIVDTDLHGLGGGNHAPEQAGFGLVLDVSYGQWADPEGSVRRYFNAVRHRLKAFDPGWRHGVGVGGDQKAARGLKLRARQNADAGPAATGDDLGGGEDCGLLGFVTAVRRLDVCPEPLLDFAGALGDAPDAVITYERDISAFARGDHRNRKSEYAGRAEHGEFCSLKVAPSLVAERFLDAGHHRGRGRE